MLHKKCDDSKICPMKLERSRGFTLIELLIVIGITTILAGVSSVIYGNLQISSQLNEISAQIVQDLRIAQAQSNAGLNDFDHGVKFTSLQYTIYQGSSYATRDSSYDRIYSLPSAIILSTTLTGGEVLFSKGVGMPNATGTVTITHSVNGLKTISINNQGIILEQ